jgi:hypothetical protein
MSAVAGIKMPARDLRSPASFEGTTSNRSASILIDCLASSGTGGDATRWVRFDTA